MTCLELDGEVLEIAKTWFALEENENVKYITADGLDFMRDEVEKCAWTFLCFLRVGDML